jgi:hypothetical protein
VLRGLFGPKGEEVTRGWRKLRTGNKKLHTLHSSPNIIMVIKSERMRWAGHVERMGNMLNEYKILAAISEGKRPLRKSRPRSENNIKIVLNE